MTQVHPCKDNSEIIPLYQCKGLFLKPIARINVSVHYPELKNSLTTGGKSVSSWDIMERIKALVSPETFISLRVTKNTLEFIRFEGDLENRTVLKNIIGRLEGKTMKVTGFKELLKIRAAEAKVSFPSKYDWDSFFRDAKNMNEMKGGERPDTIHFQNLPCKWFSEEPSKEKPMPSEKLFRRVWDLFGDVRSVDIPMIDPYRPQMTSSIGGIKTFTFSNDNVFEGYVQYRDYMSFVKAMDALRGCFLFHQEGGKYWVANLKVDFDKSKHLGDESIRRRKAERMRLMEKEKQRKTTEKLSRMEADVKEKKNLDKEKKESDKTLAKIEYKIAMEERKYLIARRKLEAIRLMDYLFETIKQKVKQKHAKKKKLKEKAKERAKEENRKFEKEMEKYKEAQVSKVEEKEERLKKIQSLVRIPESKNSRHEADMDIRQSDTRKNTESSDQHLPSDSDKAERDRRLSGGPFSSRYLGDWEVKAKSQRGSEVKVSSSYVPVELSHRGSYRGRGRGGFRGMGRGGPYPYPPSSYHSQYRQGYGQDVDNVESTPVRGYGYRNENFRGHSGHRHHLRVEDTAGYRHIEETPDRGAGPVVQHDFSYLDELDRAYEKYFTSITNRNTEPLVQERDRSRSPRN